MPCLNEHQHDASCDHSNDDPNRGIESSLFNQIDFESIRCSNAIDASVCPKIFKTYENRFDTTIELQSDDDEQLLIYVPFISNVKLKSIAIMGTPGFAPSHLRAFINKDDLDFESATSSIPTQEFDLISDHPRALVPEYPTKLTSFRSVRSITLFIDANFGSDVTKLTFIGFKGEFTPVVKDPVISNYEIAANPADHKLSNADLNLFKSVQ